MKHYIAFWKNYTNTKDRTTRAGYWIPTLINCAITTLAYILAVVAGTNLNVLESSKAIVGRNFSSITLENESLFIGLVVLCGILILVTLVPNICIAIRRFHDQNNSGWHIMLFLVPCIGFIIFIIAMTFAPIEGERNANMKTV